ncbi:MAG: NUDIX hydrolase [Chloroflexota bacterium]
MQQIAILLRRFPFIGWFATQLYRLTKPQFTAGVVGIVFNAQGHVLLVEHVFHAKYPWGLPGGWVDRGEPLDTGVARELHEELQLDVTVQDVVYVEIVRKYRNHIDIAYLCEAHNSVGNLSTELLRYRWTPLDDLPVIPAFHRTAIEHALLRRT